MVRKIGINDIENLSVGAAILGTGGGGDPYIGKLMAIDAIKNHGEVDLISPEEVPDSACVIPTGMMGAPTILIEKVPNGNETMQALQILEKYINKPRHIEIQIWGFYRILQVSVLRPLCCTTRR